jgi:hypothetical protein
MRIREVGLADRLVLVTAVIVILMAAIFALLRVAG